MRMDGWISIKSMLSIYSIFCFVFPLPPPPPVDNDGADSGWVGRRLWMDGADGWMDGVGSLFFYRLILHFAASSLLCR